METKYANRKNAIKKYAHNIFLKFLKMRALWSHVSEKVSIFEFYKTLFIFGHF